MEKAQTNYEDVMSGHVTKTLRMLLGRWREDRSIIGHCSFFGPEFWFFKDLEKPEKRKARRNTLASLIQLSKQTENTNKGRRRSSLAIGNPALATLNNPRRRMSMLPEKMR